MTDDAHWRALGKLAELATHDDEESFRALVEGLLPTWDRLLRASSSMRALGDIEDDVASVRLHLIEKLNPKRGEALRTYLTWKLRHPDKDFGDWMRIVTANAARDHARSRRRQLTASPDGDTPSPKRLLNEFIHTPGSRAGSTRPPFTIKETARQLMAYAEHRLDAEQISVLRCWLQGCSFSEIAEAHGTTEEQARCQLRSAVARLRRHFCEASESA